MMPRNTVAPANPRVRSRCTIASYNGRPWYLSRSPRCIRIRVRSPVRPCMLESLSGRSGGSYALTERHQTTRRGEAHHGGGQGEYQAQPDVRSGPAPLAVLQQGYRLVAESREGGVPAAEADRQEGPPLGREGRGVHGVTKEEAQEQGAGDVDHQRAGREAGPRGPLHRASEQIAAHPADCASCGDVPEHGGKYTFQACSASPSPRCARARARTRRTSAAWASCSARPRPGTRLHSSCWRPRRHSPATSSRAAYASWPCPPSDCLRMSRASTGTPAGPRSISPSASTSSTETGSTTPRCTRHSAVPAPASRTCTGRCSCPPTACSTRSDSWRRGEASRRSTPGGAAPRS